MSLQIKTDTLSPALTKLARSIANPTPILEAMGLSLVSQTKRAFREETRRPAPWPARKKSVPWNLLRKSGALWQSIRISTLTSSSVTVGSYLIQKVCPFI